jgi:hypothetical protein
MKYTKEQKSRYFRQLRERWKEAKNEANTDEIQAIINNHGLKISVTGYAFVSRQMTAACFDGLPYLDMKTFKGWMDNGFRVIKGEKSKVQGITWIRVLPKNNSQSNNNNEDEDRSYLMPKVYSLFHKSQVEEI